MFVFVLWFKKFHLHGQESHKLQLYFVWEQRLHHITLGGSDSEAFLKIKQTHLQLPVFWRILAIYLCLRILYCKFYMDLIMIQNCSVHCHASLVHPCMLVLLSCRCVRLYLDLALKPHIMVVGVGPILLSKPGTAPFFGGIK